MSDGFGRRNVSTSNTVVRPSQRAIPRRKTTTAGIQSRSRVPISRPRPRGIGSLTPLVPNAPPPPPPRPPGAPPTPRRERLAHDRHELEEPRVLACRRAARLREVDLDRVCD